MSLTGDIVNGVVELRGVYEGQGDQAIRIGHKENVSWQGDIPPLFEPKPVSSGPHLVTITPNDNSVTMRAFYDQTKSKKALEGESIAYIQLGGFMTNNIDFPIYAYESNPPYPILKEKQMKWLDMPDIDISNSKVDFPFFPIWTAANNSNFSLEDLFKYPQQYGGLCKNTKTSNLNDYLCATMEHTIDIGLGLFPRDDNPADYFDGLTDDELVSEGILNYPYTLENLLNNCTCFYTDFIYAGYTPRPVEAPITIEEGDELDRITFFRTPTRLFIRYISRFEIGGKWINEMVNVLIYPTVDGQLQYAYLDKSELEEYEQDLLQNGSVNIDTVKDYLFQNWNQYLFLFPKPRKLQLGYGYNVFACNYKLETVEQQKIMHLKLLEEFQYNVWREFDEGTKKWSEVKYKIQTPFFSGKYNVKSSIEDLAIDRNFIVHFYD